MIIQTDDRYWDCECELDYIKKKSNVGYCPNCDTYQQEQPDSIKSEIEKIKEKRK